MAVYLNEASLDWARAHLMRLGDTDFLPKPFELEAIDYAWDDVKTLLLKSDLDTRPAGALRRCLAPKGRYSYRIVTQLDPLDSLIYAALVHEIGDELEQSRVQTGEGVVFSSRFSPLPSGVMYARDYRWASFADRCRELSEESCEYVVIADIADFFPRIYYHRVESALELATSSDGPRRALLKLIKQWNERVSYGIPTGPYCSRLVAEITIDDVDRGLLAEGASYCRFADDYRIFCSSKQHAYRMLEVLARLLQDNHGLTLQPGKTAIMTVERFRERHLDTAVRVVLRNLAENFEDLLETLGLDDPYEELEYEELDDDSREAVDAMNLEMLLDEQLQRADIDIGLTKFVLRRLGQLNNWGVSSDLLKSEEALYPVVPELVKYFQMLRLRPSVARCLGQDIMNLVTDSVIGHLPYHRAWLLSLFAESSAWDQEEKFHGLVASFSDELTRRKLILARGIARHAYWLRQAKSDFFSFGPWTRRAFLAAFGSMPRDERNNWYGAIKSRLEPLDLIVVSWARQHVVP